MKRGLTIIIAILVIVIVGVAILWLVGSKSLANKTTNDLGYVKISQKDTDSDGLSDPEEALWGTDINNADTNSDGISDSASITKNIDPVKAGSEPITGADGRIQALVQNAIEKKGAPLVSIEPHEVPVAVTFKESDLKITEVETVATITKFRDDIRSVGPYLEKVTGRESTLLNKFIETGDKSALLAINAERQNYFEMLKAFLSITVPESAVELYLTMLNDLGQVVETVDYMSQVETEPLFALKSSQVLGLRRAAFLLNFVPINNYFVTRGIHEKITF